MILLELFSDIVNWEWTSKQPGLWSAVFEIDGLEYQVDIAGAYSLSVSFTTKHGQGITGTGNAFAVFSTVINIMREAINERHPKMFAFSAKRNQPSRVKLYHRMAMRLAQEFTDYELEIDTEDTREVMYLFNAKQIYPR
jgi:hypothetical protein